MSHGDIKRESTHCGLPTPEASVKAASPLKVEGDDLRSDFRKGRFVPNGGLPGSVGTPQSPIDLDDDDEMVPQWKPVPTPSGPTAGSLEILGRDVQKLVEFRDKLGNIGLKDIAPFLPEVVLVGDQSSGKSSLMSAIAEIHLPRGSGTCTRVVTNIKTGFSAEWTCEVSLQESYAFDPTRRTKCDFPGWVELDGPLGNKPFTVVHDVGQLEEVLQWAQIALLNPTEEYTTFIPGTPGHQRQKDLRADGRYKDLIAFSPNVIAVDINGPRLPSLSFYDLPGLIQTPPTQEERDKILVVAFKKLTQKYISHPKALIICAISMSNDPGNSYTKRIIQEAKASKAEDRCIGVLTMPDLVQNANSDYTGIFHPDQKLRKFVLKHGYFVTKQPGPSAQPPSQHYHEHAREVEDGFFATNSYWEDTEGIWAHFKPRCGTQAIQSYLSAQFARLILESIPNIEGKIHDEKRYVESELEKLPENPSETVSGIVREILNEFRDGIRDLIEGKTAQGRAFRIRRKTLNGQFSKALDVMKPGCVCHHPSEDAPAVIFIDDSDNTSVASLGFRTPQHLKRPLPNGTSSTRPNKQQRPDGAVSVKDETLTGMPAPVTPVKLSNGFGLRLRKFTPEEFGPFCQDYLHSGNKAMSLSDIKSTIEEHAVDGKPGDISPEVAESFALQSINMWAQPLETYLSQMSSTLKEEIQGVLRATMENYTDTDLYRSSKGFLEEFLEEQKRKQNEAASQMYNIEHFSLFTLNEEAFLKNRQDALEVLAKARRAVRVKLYLKRHPPRNAHEPKDAAAKVTDEQLKDLGPDPFKSELEVAAYIRGYYTTARLRFIDAICASNNVSLHRDILLGLKGLLVRKLELDTGNGEEKCRALLERSRQVAERRRVLLTKKAQIENVIEVLNQLRKDTSNSSITENRSDTTTLYDDDGDTPMNQYDH
ncbi:P-loop containing nucleoside triphosphate hydrolase protein [Amylocarpus encephaloides]|uniref:P-loop containing nucleoside triphosphate hydrolase protein n=1 Tax=Amylocarpus encephaloides TaxID=45428 RepID=A0A9P7YGD1_9HELO|nr:P-loop containing nucleoside triphosphate hydrolase protein [Amylocarpus encephaloides]